MCLKLVLMGCCVAFVAFVAFVACVQNEPSIFRDKPESQQPPVLYDDGAIDGRISDLIAANVLRFAIDLSKELSRTSNRKIEAFSPLSVMSALAPILLGAKGQSYEELSQLFSAIRDNELRADPSKFHLEFSRLLIDLQAGYLPAGRGIDNWRFTVPSYTPVEMRSYPNGPGEYLVTLANGIFTKKYFNFNTFYRQIITSVYRSELSELDFAKDPENARATINRWVSDKTLGKIPNIFEEKLESATHAIIASALYFKGAWEYEFFTFATRVENFYPDGESKPPTKAVTMSTIGNYPYYNAIAENFEIIGLPYRGNLTTMYIILPHDSDRTKLSNLQQSLNEVKIEELIQKMHYESVQLTIPKMHITQGTKMTKYLKALGIKSVFEYGLSDLSLIGGDGNQKPTAAAAAASAPAAPVPLPSPPLPASFYSNANRSHSFLDRYNEKPLIFSRSGFTSPTDLESLRELEHLRREPSTVPSELYIDEVVHKVDIDINEQGTVAAAATGINIKKSGPQIVLRAVTPFLFFIRHDPTRLVMFYGTVNEPPSP